jgi:hypothetical protein
MASKRKGRALKRHIGDRRSALWLVRIVSRVWDGRRSCGITPARWLTNPCMRRGLQRVERGSSVIDSDRVAVEPSPVFGAWFERATIVIGAAIVPR